MGTADRQIGAALDALSSPADPPAAGVAAAVSGALAASLLELSAGLAAKRLAEEADGKDAGAVERMRTLSGRGAELRQRLLEAADEDAAAYAEVARADEADRAAALAAAADPPLAIAECAAEVAEAAAETAGVAREWAFGADAAVASELAAAAARGAARLVEVDLAGSDDPRVARAREAAERASGAVPAHEG